MSATAGETLFEQLHEQLRRLDEAAVQQLERGLHAMAEGDFTVRARPELVPVADAPDDAHLRALTDLCNAMAQRLQAATEAYESLRAGLADALGDRSCLPELSAGLRSLDEHCLTDLDAGLQAVADGDLTRAASPVTQPLRAAPGFRLGELGTTFNDMLARSRTALRSYDAVREDLRLQLGDRSSLDELRAGLQSLQRHCLRDLEEALEAIAQGTQLTRPIAPVTAPIAAADGTEPGELGALFNRALHRARAAVGHLAAWRDRTSPDDWAS